jgi:(2Fe-2S) ferredoxin
MKRSSLVPRAQLFVCVNRRAEGDPLGEGCAARGDAAYAALKREVASRGLVRDVWVARSHCVGHCPRRGCTVAVSPGGRYFVEVEPGDAAALVEGALRPGDP